MHKSVKTSGIVSAVLFACIAMFDTQTAQAETKIVMLGTGTPVPDTDRAGAGIAVVYNDEAYVFDIGGGVVQHAIAAAQKKNISGLYPTKIDHLFLTHLHSDHVLDYPELIATYWWRRDNQIKVFGPFGTKAMSEGVYEMLADDTQTRLGGNQPVVNRDAAYADVTEFSDDGVILKDGDVTVEAFAITHGNWDNAFAYRVTTPDRIIVISGDTTYNEKLREVARGADVLLHEAISHEGWSGLPENWQAYHASAHTLSTDLAKLANETRPGLLVLYHVLHYAAPIESTLNEITERYDGKVVLANDLDVF
ncbi:MBL fold metallo-hydrolase [Thalassospira sp. A3_1]|uniref:MBL fold metallo-hydrolase n=1 Tax=Thalassospira sp. A3_1 TaxID=2821088 RepID=UPI001ADBEE09|nr:MBL fold metallo-hydrolase [Thalassospira sp. A3_1]MBO9507425.1 MBL fold metallo-hydrolase [Thalassospira sp. A3_1]